MKKLILLSCLLLTAFTQTTLAQQKFTLNGYVKDAANGEELIGATVLVKELGTGVTTNVYGFYALSLPAGDYQLEYSYVGFESLGKTISLNENLELNISLGEAATQMEEIVITEEKAEEARNVERITMSRNEIPVDLVKKTHALFGEPDIIKTVQMMPGVISAGEGTSSYFVRGGGADQNLILIDEAPIYDPSHFFGLFSVFNADVIKDSELYKGGIPAQFGGRLSSILEVRTKDGNNQQLSGSGSIGLLASKVMLEGPIANEKSSFLVSARRSYADVFLQFAPNDDLRENQVYFYDINAKVNWKPSNQDRFFVAVYAGRDAFDLNGLFGFNWGNKTGTFRWNHLFSEKLFSNTTFIASEFDYQLESSQSSSAFEWSAGLQEFSLKQDFNYFMNPQNILSFGVSAAYRNFLPSSIRPGSDESYLASIDMGQMRAMDYAAYISNEHQLSERLSLLYGLRLSVFQPIGETTIYDYAQNEQGLPDNQDINIVDSTYYGSGEVIETFARLEPRFSARYLLGNDNSVKLSYNRMAQYVHLLSNSTIPVPFNTWTPSSPYLEPQMADQVALGYFQDFNDHMYAFSAEAYYKKMQNVTDFADNANLLLNPDAPAEYRQGEGESYGLEFFLQKNKGRLTGFASYTWSKAEVSIPGVNQGIVYPANFDRRHVANVVATYFLSDRWTLGGNFTYSTGRPFTLPVGRYQFDDYNVDLYPGRNAYRLPDFHRLDLSASLTPRKNEGRRWKTEWNFAIYNAYNRKNAFTILTQVAQDDDGNIIDPNKKEARMIYLFPMLPSVSYKISF
jgi:hypothetical protein